MYPVLDKGLDELATQSFQGLPGRVLVAVGVGLIGLTLLPWAVAMTWTLAVLGLEGWSWFATRRQFLGLPISDRRRMGHFLNLVAISAAWFALGAMFWLTGSSDGAICAVTVWLSLIAYGQAFAFQSPIGYVVSGGLPAAGMLLLTLLAPPSSRASLAPVWMILVVAVAFAGAGFRQMLSSRKRFMDAQNQLRASEAGYRILADNVNDVISRHGADRQIQYVSPSVEKLFGYSPADLMATGGAYIHPEDLPLLSAAIGTSGMTATNQTAEYRILRKDGAVIWVESSISPLADSPGEVVAVSRDITARKQLEADLVAAAQVAEAAAASKADFLANMTHELRTPLTAIIGFSEVLKGSTALSARDNRHAGLISEASVTLLGVVNSVLDFSKLEAGGLEFDPQPFDPEALARSVVSIVQDQAAGRDLELTLVGEDDGDELTGLLGDGPRIGQVLLNFLSNAIKFTQEGSIQVVVERHPAVIGERLRMEVRDTGMGIAEDKLNLLFERFTQADATVSRQFGGTGLGLAIARRTVEAMGGAIGATSRPGEGSTFWFEVDLPVAALNNTPDSACEFAAQDRPVRLLLAEDNATNRELITTLLEPFDIDITIACNGAEAVESALSRSFDLILMDVQMPVMDGLTATRRIRALALHQSPIIAMTANVLPEQVQRCLEAGMDDHIGKPLSAARLIDCISVWSQGREGQSAPDRITA